MLPRMAMPSAPPSSRVVSFTADPTPALLSGTDDMIAQLQKLGELHANGILTDEEFAAQKAKLLG